MTRMSQTTAIGIRAHMPRPYVKGLPIVATVKSSNSRGEHVVQTIRPTYEDAYTLEYKALYDNIINGSKVKTDPMDGKRRFPNLWYLVLTIQSQGGFAHLPYDHGCSLISKYA